jgi:diguanylate cyclase (GGDEF)-like protein
MPGDKQAQASQVAVADRREEIERQIQELSGRDLQLWSIGILVMLVLTSGVLALVLPNLVWQAKALRVENAYLPQLFFGLISLVILFNIYAVTQKRALNSTRKTLIRELIFSERMESLSLIDPLTQLFNRRAVEPMIAREVARANRLGSGLTFIFLDLDGFRNINSRFGNIAGDELLVHAAKLLKSTFRGGDIVFRYGGDEFLAVLPETTQEQAERPIERLLRAVEFWNLNSGKEFEMSLSWGVASYVTGSNVADVLRAADRKLYQRKNKLVPIF